MTKGRVMVYCRTRPPLPREDGCDACVFMDEANRKVTLRMEDEGAMDRVLSGQSVDSAANHTAKDFEFDGVFDPGADQKAVYEAVGKPVLKDVLQGYNGSILAYGQTGSGKTHSLLNTGGKNGAAPKEAGLLPRVVAALFIHISSDVKSVYGVEVAMFQIYNDTIDDLLVEGHAQGKGSNLLCQKGGNVHGLTWTPCKSPDELLKAFAKGRNNIVYAETKMNKASSRSHAVFQIKVSRRDRATEKGQTGQKMRVTLGKLTIVDLAGSERVKKSGVQGQQLKEAVNINGSLLAFGNVVSALAEKKKFIPYRDSKLTQILEDSMGGNSKTSLLVCTSPAQESANETLNTLEFASRAMKVEVDAQINEGTVVVDASRLAADLAGDGINEELKQQHKIMQQLEASMKEKAAKDKAAAEKAAKELKAQKDEAAKAMRESGALVAKWKEAADAAKAKEKELADKAAKELEAKDAEMKKKVQELEAKVAEAAQAKDVKAKLSAKEGEVLTLQDQLRAAKAELASAKEAMAKDAEERVAAASSAHDDELDRLRRERDAAVAKKSEAETAAAAAQDRVAELEKELAGLRDGHASALAEERAAAARAAKAAAERAAADKAMGEELAAKEATREAQAQAARLLESRAAAWAQEKADAAKAHDAEVAEWKARVEGVASSAAADTRKKLGDAASAHAKAIAEVEANHAETKAALAKSESEAGALRSRVRDLEADGASLRADVASRDARLEESKRAAAAEAEAHAKVMAEADAALAELTARAAREKEELRAEAADAVEKLAASEARAKRRQSVAFAAARCALAMKTAGAQEDLAALQLRFDSREPRKEDVAQIQSLSTALKKERAEAKALEREKKQVEMELENRDLNDSIFCGKNGRGAGGSQFRRAASAHAYPAAAGIPMAAAAAAAAAPMPPLASAAPAGTRRAVSPTKARMGAPPLRTRNASSARASVAPRVPTIGVPSAR